MYAKGVKKIERKEALFRGSLHLSAFLVVILPLTVFGVLVASSLISIKTLGFSFLFKNVWDPVSREFGAVPFLLGTLITSFFALLLSLPFSVSIAIFLGEYLKKGIIATFIKSAIEVLAAIPSVIYGFWGLFVLVSLIRNFELIIGVPPYGVGILTSSLILTLMIIPYSASIGREVILLVPDDVKEAAYSLGATRFEVIKRVILPTTRSGLMTGILLSLGRALGETMAVTMVIGNTYTIPKSIFDPGNTMASIIANEFTEAVDPVYLSALIELGLLLFLVSTTINILGRRVIRKMPKLNK